MQAKVMTGWSFRELSAKQIAGRIIFSAIILSSLIIGAICVKNAVEWVDKPFPGFLLNQRVVVGYIGQYYWTGTQAGLRYPDKILKVNDQAISSTKELDGIIHNTKIGYPVKYHVERENRVIEVVVPTMRFTQLDLLMTFGIIFFMGMLYLLIGIVVFVLKPDATISWVFLSGCFLQAISSFVSFDLETTHFGFVRAYLFDEAFLPAVVLHLSMLFPEKARFIQKYPRIQIIPYIISIILAYPLELLYPRPSFTPVYEIVLFYMIISVMALIASILYAYLKKSSALARQRAKVVLVGAVLALPVPATAPFLAFLGETFGKVKIATNFSSIPIIIFPASIAYAIAKHNLFDVDVYIKRAVGYGIMTALVGTAYFSIQMIVRPAVLHPLFGEYSEKIYPILFALLIVFLFNPINRRIQKGVDKLFYRKKFDYKETVINVSNALTSMLNLAEVTKKIINTVRKEMFIDTAGVVMMDHQKKECRPFFIGDGPDNIKDDIKEVCIPYDDPLLSLLSKEKKLITKYDIEEDPHYRYLKESCSQRFSDMGASMLTPLIYQGEVTGALALGYKKSGHFYTRADIDLLNTLANHGAVAIENAKLVDQIKKEEIIRANLSRYLSPQIVEDIIKKDVQVNLGGDRRVVTVLFMDMIGFTSLSERLQPEEVVSILNEYFTEMSEAIFRWEGTLEPFAGDQIMAVWGAPTDQPGHAELAVRCAIDLSKKLNELRMRWKKEGKPVLDSGIGINTGEALVGNIGVEGKKMDYTVIGDNVNLAARVEKLTRQYKTRILFTEYTFQHIEDCVKSNRLGHIKLTDLAEVKVKGKEKGVRIYKLEPIEEI